MPTNPLADIREEFAAIVSGWTLISGIHAITDRIEEVAEWAKVNGPLLPGEEATVHMMIQTQIARGEELYLDWED